LEPNETPGNSASLLDQSLLTPRQHFHQLCDIEALKKLKQTRNLWDEN